MRVYKHHHRVEQNIFNIKPSLWVVPALLTTEIYENLKYKNKKQAKRKQTERNTKQKKTQKPTKKPQKKNLTQPNEK